jgi:hypothetical protein
MNNNIPTVSEVLACKTYAQYFSLIRYDYGLDGNPKKAWIMDLGHDAWGKICDHVNRICQKELDETGTVKYGRPGRI